MRDERDVLGKLRLEANHLDAGCCGMAGAFGFEREHYGVSMQCGERVLLPAVRAAGRDTLIIADGFSCREQIAQSTDRHAVHLAEVLDLAISESGRRTALYAQQSHQKDRRAYVRARDGQRR
jgi:Fe-S oxidoreductase